MKKPDELEIIKIFQKHFGKKQSFIPEDLELLHMDGRVFIVKSDMLVQSTDVPHGMKLKEISRKSIVSCVSDFACKGIKPRYATISLAIPRGFGNKEINELARGFCLASREFGLKIIGGDVNEGKEIVIDVSMFGTGNRIIPRGGARKGDIIITTGPFGFTSLGLELTYHRLKIGKKLEGQCRKSVFTPMPRLQFGLKAARYFSSSMDSSDGLSATLNDMSKLSNKKFVITHIPAEKELRNFAKDTKRNLEKLVFCGGEEYEIIATVSPRNLKHVRKIAKMFQIPLFEIGFVSEGKNVVLSDGFKERVIKRCGWIHLRS